MGVIYKLKPEIREFIIKQKKEYPFISCRAMGKIIKEKFNLNISKSHINILFKKTGLNIGKGRTPKIRKITQEAEGLGAFLLKGVETLFGGVSLISDYSKRHLPKYQENESLTEALLYKNLFEENLALNSGLWKLIGKIYHPQVLSEYLIDLQGLKELKTILASLFLGLLEEVLFLKLTFMQGAFYIDSQFYTLWSQPHIPYDFSLTLNKTKTYINKIQQKDAPLILFTAPGYETIPKDWFNFLLTLKQNSPLLNISLFNSQLKEIESIEFFPEKKISVIFGLWPWQYNKYRKIEYLTEFKPFIFKELKKEFYFAQITIKLTQHQLNQSVTLKGFALKKDFSGPVELVILSNQEDFSQLIINQYISKWPNLEETFQDFSKKIERFSYDLNSRQSFPYKEIISVEEDLSIFFKNYLGFLDRYLVWYFLPQEYRKFDFSLLFKRFYFLRAKIKKTKTNLFIKFMPPKDYPYLKDLTYLTRRLNEKEIFLSQERRLLFI
ncbi:MAG: hypothetical protein NC900_02620 [Candidatus Omnitrophica bacterium]|nr:hypothetical protein [Candidatus Omnitrophota bacterium]